MAALLSVDEALQRVLADAGPLGTEAIPIEAARGRVLGLPLAALRTQPPFDASAMDGFAVRSADVTKLPATLAVIGQAAAGHPFGGSVGPGEAVRIFTGAPVPPGADAIVVQENTEHTPTSVTVRNANLDRDHIRPRGYDFKAGEPLLTTGRRLGPRELSLAAAMGHGTITAFRRPLVAILSTGDELVEPGTEPAPGQIVSSNHLGVAAMAELAGAQVRHLGIARDTRESLEERLDAATGCDLLVTIGGASVGDHDLVGPVLQSRGLDLAFWRIAMRPGRPLMFGRLKASRVMGLPGNPVSALVCARVFMVPLLRRMSGEPAAGDAVRTARAAVPIEANGPRQHYMRATLRPGADGTPEATPVRSQDSSLLSPLALADCLLVRTPNAPAVPAGAMVPILALDF